jgi:3-phenylpropionate/cinnamic acid dioxygenase small subunit
MRPGEPVGIDTESKIELHELAARYGDLIDGRDWPGLAAIFTDDAEFDLTNSGGPLLTGLQCIQEYMDGTDQHPLAHLIVNIYVTENPDGVKLHSRVIGVLLDRRVGSGSYVDDVVRTASGWRIRRREFTLLRRPRPVPADSDG